MPTAESLQLKFFTCQLVSSWDRQLDVVTLMIHDRCGSCKLAADCFWSKVLIFFYVMVGGGFVLVISVRSF